MQRESPFIAKQLSICLALLLVGGCSEEPLSIQGETLTGPQNVSGGEAGGPLTNGDTESGDDPISNQTDGGDPLLEASDEGVGAGPSDGTDVARDDSGMVMPEQPARDPETPQPDRVRFTEDVLPLLLTRCGNPACHGSAVRLGNRSFEVFGGSADELSANQIDLVMEEVLDSRFVDYEDIEGSDLLTHHEGQGAAFAEFIPGSDTYAILVDWLRDAFFGPESMEFEQMMDFRNVAGTDAVPADDMNQPGQIEDTENESPTDELMGGSATDMPPIPAGPTPAEIALQRCGEIPVNDGIGPDGWRSEFDRLGINQLFVGDENSPFGSCGGSGCHTERGAGGTLYFRAQDDPCSADWNFFVTQSFVRPFSPLNSPILVKPLGEETPSGRHGGAVVFQGRTDPQFLSLRLWLETLLTN